MCRKCEICRGDIEHGVCTACGLSADDYIPDDELAEQLDDENTILNAPPAAWPPSPNPN